MHIAAGTDLPTALAALPRDEQPPATATCIHVVALMLAAVIIAWWLLA